MNITRTDAIAISKKKINIFLSKTFLFDYLLPNDVTKTEIKKQIADPNIDDINITRRKIKNRLVVH